MSNPVCLIWTPFGNAPERQLTPMLAKTTVNFNVIVDSPPGTAKGKTSRRTYMQKRIPRLDKRKSPIRTAWHSPSPDPAGGHLWDGLSKVVGLSPETLEDLLRRQVR